MKSKKFCCESFQFRHSGNSEMGLNFRILKLSEEFIKRGYNGKNKYRYLITEGYHKLDDNTKMIVMEYCPYCGTRLNSIYNSDDYINELFHNW